MEICAARLEPGSREILTDEPRLERPCFLTPSWNAAASALSS